MNASDPGARVAHVSKPRHTYVDAWGVTHVGKVGKENQGHDAKELGYHAHTRGGQIQNRDGVDGPGLMRVLAWPR